MNSAALASLLPVPVAIPITGAVLAPLIARVSRRGALVAAVIAMTSTTVVLCLLAPTVYRGHILVQYSATYDRWEATRSG